MADAQKDLRAAWDDLIAELQRARDAIDQPELMPAPPTDRNLAEGYRYLAGFVHSAIERAFHHDPRFPSVPQRAVDPHQGHDRQRRRDLLHRADRRPRVVRRARAGRAITATGAASRPRRRAGSRRST
jgi:hypothetical protein